MELEKLETSTNNSNYGGARIGAGRKSKEELFQELNIHGRRKEFLKLVTAEDFSEIVKNYLQKAKTDSNMAEYVINQLIGKSMQAVEVTGKDGEALIPVDRAVDILKLYVDKPLDNSITTHPVADLAAGNMGVDQVDKPKSTL